ncbi:phosphatidylethanolamine N-methyltransferase [Fomitopsis serialis]|uniref:phosphatidylethanolamine N-methyltransferase n=1 Tax=Fomitopsis serialis TaxID=139415 RepID=UPI002008C9EE|nr:phosphatidylethanolamine N-methyltransferase [Neoantrodia serialis]KAH9922238.1 phosphatidylethanolamine N-methyltransferase [Neoantrodia serialis]
MASGDTPHTLRHRRKGSNESDATHVSQDETRQRKTEEVVWGKTPSGEVFRVPTTHDVLTALFHPAFPKSHLDLLNLGLLGLQLVLFFVLPRNVAKVFFFVYFAFWRAAYDLGLGWVLTKQSRRKWIVREVQRLGWLDEKRMPAMRNWIRQQLAGKMGKDYSFDELPLEYNTWLLFRQLVDIILLNDFLAYCMFAFTCFRIPTGLSISVHMMRWIGGIALIAFNLWVKTEAHDVVKDYGWYWGDVFFQRGGLTFNGVFELAPHPMYSVGYAGYYGLSLIIGSYFVLFVSLAAHAAQFGFLVYFENPHIERTYGQKKLLALRSPLASVSSSSSSSKKSRDSPVSHDRQVSSSSISSVDLPTPSATEGETATETDGPVTETETETEYESKTKAPKRKLQRRSASSLASAGSMSESSRTRRAGSPIVSQHDLMNRYFRQDTIFLKNLDLLRASDIKLVLIMFYPLALSVLPSLSPRGVLVLHFVHALTWCLMHSFGLGLLLRAQSQRKFLVRHFLKHYHYPAHDHGRGAVIEAFTNWKSMYNLSMCMTYVSFICLAWKTYTIPQEWTVGVELLRHTMGAVSWFFGDFFVEDFPSHLDYTGIYRYLNNPEIMSGAAFFGLTLISGSKLVAALAVIRHLSQWWFLSKVENPHMRKLYGDSLRNDAGFVKVIKKVANKNARLLESRAGRHAPEIRRVAREVKGTFDKVYEETADVVEEFLAKSRPKISEVVQDTKILLQQSRERLVISYYKVSIVPAADGSLRFHLGEPIRVQWRAPLHHSRAIGLAFIGEPIKPGHENSSLGMWVPVHDEEWDGDIPLSLNRPNRPDNDSEDGKVVFQRGTLPWQTGRYEIRYHHDGKYNVMGLDGPFEVYVDKPSAMNFDSIRRSLMHIVPLCLDSDPSLIPLSCKSEEEKTASEDDDTRDPDDFRFWSERQAKRISAAIKQAFGVELTPEVVVADANINALANRVLLSKELLSD